ncbi:MAG: hypothetical protein IKU43_07860, partial [Clostridia bacterium]|nr:hypothetical protein [Clostridia bacterium]
TTVAYIDATGNEPVDIATLTFTFGQNYSYDTLFVTGEDEGSDESATVASAKAVMHEKDSYDVTPVDVTAVISNMLVFTADDFTLGNLETVYNGKGQTYTVDSDVADSWDICVGDNAESTVTDAGEYRVFLKDVAGEGYYDAVEVEFTEKFVINKATVAIQVPKKPAAVDYVPGGYDLANLEIEGWEVQNPGKVNAGTHDVALKYVGKFDTKNNIYTFDNIEVTSPSDLGPSVELVVNKIPGTIPELQTNYEVTYDENLESQWIMYYVDLSEGWEWSDASMIPTIGENKNILVMFLPKDTDNYTYEGLVTEGYISPLVEGRVNVTLKKAEGTAPALPVVTASKRLESADAALNASDFITNSGVWSYSDKKLTVGKNTIEFIYKPLNTDKYDYSELENWNSEKNQFEYTAEVEVLKPYLNVIVPPANPAHKTYVEGGIKCGEFVLADGWEFFNPDATFTSAGEYERVRVRYPIPEGYDINPESGYTVEDGYIESTVSVFIDKAPFPVDDVSFLQTATYTGEKFAITEKVALKDLSDVTEDDFTLYCDADIVNAGNYDVYATVKETANYLGVSEKFKVGIFTVDKATVTKDMFTVTDNEHVYDGTDKSATITVKDGVTPPTVSINDNNGSSAVGEYSIRVTGAASTNYNAYTLLLDTKVIVTKEIVTITAPANPAAVDYVEGGVKASDRVSIEDWSVITDASFNAGTHAIPVRYNGTMDFNSYTYKFNGETVTAAPETTVEFTVNKIALPEDVFTAEKVEAVYDGTAKEITVKVNDKYTGVGQYTIEYSAVSVVNAGKYTAFITFAEGTNYLGLTFELADIIVIAKADVVKEDITLANTEYTYDGTAKKATATAKDGIGAPTVSGEGTNAGTYTVTVAGEETTNYKAYTLTFENALVIKKADVAKADITVANTEYTFDGTAKKATATAKEGVGTPTVSGEGTNAGTYSFTVAGEATDNYNAYSFTYENALVINKADVAKTDITLANTEYTYDGTAKKATATAKDGMGVPTVTGEGTNAGSYTVTVAGEATDNYNAYSFTFENALVINKVALPADAATAEKVTVEYDGNAKTVTVTANSAYNGLGDFTVAYPDGNINAGTYKVTATFAEGKNYKGGTLTFTDALVITKKALATMSVPTIVAEAYVGEEFKGNAGESFVFAQDYVIVEGENKIVVTKTIEGSFAKNYDYTAAAAAAGVTLTVADNNDVTFTKEYTIIGKAKTGKISITATTVSAVEGASELDDVYVLITPENDDSYFLDATQYTEIDNEIKITDLELEFGKYTVTIKKQKYLLLTLDVTIDEDDGVADEFVFDLIPGDIIGGEAGNETAGDGVIDIDDFVIAIRSFDTASGEAVKAAADINEDGSNNVTDLGFIKANFNKTTEDYLK